METQNLKLMLKTARMAARRFAHLPETRRQAIGIALKVRAMLRAGG